MFRLRAALRALFLGVLVLRPGFGLGATIPRVRGTTLAGNAVDLPGDLRGKTAVLVIGFGRGSQDAVRGWGRRLAADYRNSSTVTYYEIAVVAEVPWLLRGAVIRSIKKSVPERAQARFFPVTEDEAGWRSVAHYGQPDAAYVLLVDGAGTVRWQTIGPPDDAAYSELKRHLAT